MEGLHISSLFKRGRGMKWQGKETETLISPCQSNDFSECGESQLCGRPCVWHVKDNKENQRQAVKHCLTTQLLVCFTGRKTQLLPEHVLNEKVFSKYSFHTVFRRTTLLSTGTVTKHRPYMNSGHTFLQKWGLVPLTFHWKPLLCSVLWYC